MEFILSKWVHLCSPASASIGRGDGDGCVCCLITVSKDCSGRSLVHSAGCCLLPCSWVAPSKEKGKKNPSWMSPPVYVLMCFHFRLTVLLIKTASGDPTSVRISPAGFVNFTASNAPLAVFVSAALNVSTHLHVSGRERACVCDSDLERGAAKWSVDMKHLVYTKRASWGSVRLYIPSAHGRLMGNWSSCFLEQ